MDKVDHFERKTILRRTICEGNIGKVDHLRENNFKVYHLRGKHGKIGPFVRKIILRRTICEGNMDKVDHLRGHINKVYHLRGKQF